MTRLMMVVLGALAVCACGVRQEDFATEYVKAICDYDVKCALAQSLATCVANQNATVRPMIEVSIRTGLEPGQQAGTIRYDAQQARACLDAIRAATCNAYPLSNPCGLIFQGTKAVGAPCGPAECVPQAFCSNASSGPVCTGVCKARVADGAPAGPTDMCVDGLVLSNGTCHQPTANGGRCSGGGECERSSSCVSGTCLALPSAGQPCPNQACFGAYQCVNGTCVPPGAVGDACGACLVELECVNTRCTARQPKGGACGPYADCDVGLVCVGVGAAATCTPLGEPGASCATVPCSWGSYCSQSKVCTPQVPVGGACSASEPSDQCQVLPCVGSVCPAPQVCK